MLSEFRKKKLLYVFKMFFDVDESGTIEKKDFDDSLNIVAKLQGWDVNDSRFKVGQEVMAQIWNGLSAAADKDNDGKINAEEWIAMWSSHDKASMPEWQQLYCRVIFHIQDYSQDGAVDSDEYVKVHTAFGTDKDQASEAFKKLSDGKPSITWDDFQKRFEEFFMSDDENAPGNYLFASNKFD
ncbi:calexcitin-2-like [Leptidea sinapis]|uniref:EF-hand domain-containing protein n=1 Tax=Leptidea sinapis TaxID=189913 RepID=A0A5E4PXM7_9NEOP|nr:calexcitin-2-like [Leptidea sinapis]VVC89763.1 unnamed protein product [Leptidea sinapis]